ncbi:hypothetical protein Ciccas_001845 [Cichlidogyrus casuarinus]|uniref:Uncharacterized protein n=1 Tax=Cichlidogyrus casuarinus TaxID=1844966 RepID=A0ABD2QIZ2_9PLAT
MPPSFAGSTSLYPQTAPNFLTTANLFNPISLPLLNLDPAFINLMLAAQNPLYNSLATKVSTPCLPQTHISTPTMEQLVNQISKTSPVYYQQELPIPQFLPNTATPNQAPFMDYSTQMYADALKVCSGGLVPSPSSTPVGFYPQPSMTQF